MVCLHALRVLEREGKEDLAPPSLFRKLRELLDYNNQALERMADRGKN